MAASNIIIRPATTKDIPAVNSIHRHYVLNTVITFSTKPSSDDSALTHYRDTTKLGLPFIVATNGKGVVLGYSCVSTFRGVRPAYAHTLELSLFCHPEHTRQGIGRQLLTRLIEILEQPEKWRDWLDGKRLFDHKPRQLLAVMAVDIEQPGNGLKLRDWYIQLGFEQKGRLEAVGFKKDRWIDTIYLQRTLGVQGDSNSSLPIGSGSAGISSMGSG